MSNKIYTWVVDCLEESIQVIDLRYESDGAPTLCPNDHANRSNIGGVTLLNIGDPEERVVEIKEETIPTNGKFQFDGRFAFCAESATTSTFDTSFPHAVSVLDFWWRTEEQDRGDRVTLIVGPDTPIGALTTDATAGDTVLNVQPTVVNNIYPGDTAKLLVSGNAPVDVGQVLLRDPINDTITLETPLSQNWSATAPTIVLGNVHIIKDAELGTPGAMVVGRSKIGASYIPANTAIRTLWTSRSPIERIGQVTADVPIGATSVSVDAVARENIYWGDKVEITDGSSTEDLGHVTTVYRYEGIIAFENATTQSYLAATPTYIRKTGKRVTGHVEFLR